MKKKIDIPLLIAVICLTFFGLVMIYSASSIWADYKFHDAFHYVKQQALFAGAGFLLLFLIIKIDYRKLYEKSNFILLACFILLILVLIPGIGSVRNGSRSWFGIGSFGIQPSEFAKLGLILFTSKYLSVSNQFLKSYRKGVFPILFISLLFFGLIMLQPDLGTGVVLMMSIIALLFVAGVNMKFFYGMGFIGLIGVVIFDRTLSNESNYVFSKSVERSLRNRVSNDSILVCDRTRWIIWNGFFKLKTETLLSSRTTNRFYFFYY